MSVKCPSISLPIDNGGCHPTSCEPISLKFDLTENLIYRNDIEYARIISIKGNKVTGRLPNGDEIEIHVVGLDSENSTIGGKPITLGQKILNNGQ